MRNLSEAIAMEVAYMRYQEATGNNTNGQDHDNALIDGEHSLRNHYVGLVLQHGWKHSKHSKV